MMQGFRTAEKLANKVVPFFKLCDEQLSSQPHYDFGLRALKYVLVSAGNVKRERIERSRNRGWHVEKQRSLRIYLKKIQVCRCLVFFRFRASSED